MKKTYIKPVLTRREKLGYHCRLHTIDLSLMTAA